MNPSTSTSSSRSSNNEFDFCPVLNELLQTGATIGRGGKVFNDLTAVSTLNNLHILRRLHLHLKPKRTLEIGLCFGGSCLLLAATHQAISGQPAHQHTALDPFQKDAWDDAGLFAIERAGLSGYLNFHSQFSNRALPQLLEAGQKFGLIYIDGSHVFEEVFIDAYYSARLLEENGVMVFDDCRDPHVKKVVKFIRSNLKSSLQELDLSPFRADGGKSLVYRAAKAAGQTQLTAFQKGGELTRPYNVTFTNF
jgi:predicted O-methyltransferase YrrM